MHPTLSTTQHRRWSAIGQMLLPWIQSVAAPPPAARPSPEPAAPAYVPATEVSEAFALPDEASFTSSEVPEAEPAFDLEALAFDLSVAQSPVEVDPVPPLKTEVAPTESDAFALPSTWEDEPAVEPALEPAAVEVVAHPVPVPTPVKVPAPIPSAPAPAPNRLAQPTSKFFSAIRWEHAGIEDQPDQPVSRSMAVPQTFASEPAPVVLAPAQRQKLSPPDLTVLTNDFFARRVPWTLQPSVSFALPVKPEARTSLSLTDMMAIATENAIQTARKKKTAIEEVQSNTASKSQFEIPPSTATAFFRSVDWGVRMSK
ncbi:MAG TPA: hypothetical protein PKE58_11445 [Acidobacteriota bacterium]|nr:hypothetical protein [Acidobacteriota bacterium]